MVAVDVMPVRLHLQGIKVLEVLEDRPERLVVAVAGVGSVQRCTACGFKTAQVHQRTKVKVRDLPVSGRPTTLVWHRRRFRCGSCGSTFTETHPQLVGKLTLRFRHALFIEVVASTVNSIRKRHGLSWALVMALVTERVTWLARHRARRPVKVLCIDEKRLVKGHGAFSTIVSDGETGTVITVIEGRCKASLESWLKAQPRGWRAGVKVVVTDMATCWRQPIAELLPRAAHVVDRFHVVRAAMAVLTETRRTAQRTDRGQPHARAVFDARFTLATRCDRLTGDQMTELVALFEQHPHLAAAWELTQRFHRVFQADGLDAALDAVAELADAMGRTRTGFAPGVHALTRWADQWQNYHRHGRWTTNVAEGLNTKIEVLERKAYGFRDHTNHAIRILAECPGHRHRNRPSTTLTNRPAQSDLHAVSR